MKHIKLILQMIVRLLTFKKLSVQETFNLVIENDYYNHKDKFMCHSLMDAMLRGIITLSEYEQAKKEIKQYIQNNCTLVGFILDHCDEPTRLSFEYLESIYLDWENRPFKE